MALWRLHVDIFKTEKKIVSIQEDTSRVLSGNAVEDFLDTPRAKTTRIRRGTCSARAKLRNAKILDYVNNNREKQSSLSDTISELELKRSKALHIPDLALAILRNFTAEEILARFTPQQLREAVNVRSPPRGCPPLHLAIYKSNIPVIEALLNVDGVNIDLTDDAGYSALHVALIFVNFKVVKLLANAGADLTSKNRAGQSVIQASRTLGHGEAMELVLSKFALIRIVRMYVRRFLDEMFAGNPDYYHYRVKEYRDGLLLAYTLTWQPRCISQLKIKPRIPVAELFENEDFLEDFDAEFLKLFPEEDEDEDEKQKQEKGKSKRASIFNLWKPRDGQEEDESKVESSMGVSGKGNKLPEVGRGLGFQGYKLFRYIKDRKLKELIEKSKRWELDSPSSLARLCENVYDGSETPDRLKQKLAAGDKAFQQWKAANKKQLKRDRIDQMRAVADAIAAQKLREDLERKREEARLKEEEEQKERIRKGLHKLSADAGVKITHEGEETSMLQYSASTTDPAVYDVVLMSRPQGNVIIKCTIIPPNKDRPFLRTQPRVLSFTPLNWTTPQRITVSVIDADAVVRLKRSVAREPGSCNHVIRNRVQSTTDVSYKSLDLKWVPHNDVIIHVID